MWHFKAVQYRDGFTININIICLLAYLSTLFNCKVKGYITRGYNRCIGKIWWEGVVTYFTVLFHNILEGMSNKSKESSSRPLGLLMNDTINLKSLYTSSHLIKATQLFYGLRGDENLDCPNHLLFPRPEKKSKSPSLGGPFYSILCNCKSCRV